MARNNKGFINNILQHLNIFIIAAVILMVAVCCFSTHYKYSDNTITKQIKPYAVANLEDGSKEYFFDLRHYGPEYSGLLVFTTHQKVSAYSVGREIYSFNQTGGFWGSTTGCKYNFIEINGEMANTVVRVTPCYDVVADQELTFYIGSTYKMYNEIMTTSMTRYIVSLLILILSIMLIIYYSFMKEKQNLRIDIIYLAFFAFFCGVWSLVETDVSSLTVHNKIAESLVAYICLMFVIPPFMLFFDEYLNLKSKWFKNIIITYSMVQAGVLFILHFTKIAEFRETLPAMQFILLVTTIYLVVRVIIKIIKKSFSRQVFICAVGLSLFAMAMIVDLTNYYTSLGDADVLGRYTFLIFVLMLTSDLFKGTYEVIAKGRRAKQLETFALTDSMTGLLNRNAYESQAHSENNLNGLVAVVADANGLKQCNDTLGHEAGDQYISIVADIFNKVFGKYGNCYRTGGDEFCCIITQGKHVNMERLKKMFLAMIYTENLEGEYDFNIGVAIGYASYDSTIDDNFKSVVKRADSYMYEDKRISKQTS